MNQAAEQAQKPRHQQPRKQSVFFDASRAARISGADAVRHLHGKACRERIAHAVLDATSPIAAEAFAPSLPTIAESMYCMAMVVICVRIAGRLSRQTSRSRGRSA